MLNDRVLLLSKLELREKKQIDPLANPSTSRRIAFANGLSAHVVLNGIIHAEKHSIWTILDTTRKAKPYRISSFELIGGSRNLYRLPKQFMICNNVYLELYPK